MRDRSRTVEPASGRKLSRNIVGRMVTTGRPDHANACSLSQCCRCWRLGVVFRMLIWETVICERLTRAFTPTSRATVAMVTAASRYPGDTAMPKKTRRTAAHDPKDVGRLEQITDHHIGAGGPQRGRPFVLAAHHGAHRKPATEEEVGDRSPDRAYLTGRTGDEDRSPIGHLIPLLSCRPLRHSRAPKRGRVTTLTRGPRPDESSSRARRGSRDRWVARARCRVALAHSSTWSARASTAAGTVSPSALAVLRFTTSRSFIA